MPKYIDPDKLRAELTDRHLSTGRLVQWEAAMDAAMVEAPEVAHGYWIKDESTYAGPGVSNFKCSECGEFGGTAERMCAILHNRITLMQGDCLERMKEIPDGSVDMVLCDLPYGTTRCKWDNVIPFEPLWTQYRRVVKDNGAIVLFADGMFTAQLVLSADDIWRYNLVWDKQRGCDFLNANRKPLKSHEDICVFYKKRPTYNKQPWFSTPYRRTENEKLSENYGNRQAAWSESVNGERNPLTILSFARDGRRLHPTQKPVKLLEYLIKTYTKDRETVLDNCMGSGSTGVAAVNTGRNFIGIELDAEYFAIAKNRIEQETAQTMIEV